MATKVAGKTYFDIDGQLLEIKRQLRQPNGYPFDPLLLQRSLQAAIEGKFFDAFASAEPKAEVEKPKLLEFVTTIPVSAYEHFAAEKHLVVDTSKKAKVKIAWVSDNFKNLFGTKIERNVQATDVKLDRLLKSSLDRPIIDELGGLEKCSIALAHFYDALAWKQANDDLTWITGHVESDVDKATWAVIASWDADDGGWYVDADSVANPDGWSGGLQVVSR